MPPKLFFYRLAIPLALSQLIFVGHSLAEFECTSAVLYRWKRDGVEQDTHWASPSTRAPDEESAKKILTLKIASEKERALDDCKRRHENLSGCIAERFQALNQVYQGLSFAARKKLEEAVTKDCDNEFGQCLEAKSSEAQCSEIKAPGEGATTEDTAQAESTTKEGDKKKDNKKKK